MKKKEVDIAILTPIKVEFDAVVNHLSDRNSIVRPNEHYEAGFFETQTGSKCFVVVRQTGAGNTAIAVAADQVAREFHPAIVLLVGIAGGVKDVRIGDVVIGKKAYGYESGKETVNGLLSRPSGALSTQALITAAERVERQGNWHLRTGHGSKAFRVFFGPIASGEKVIATSKTQLANLLRERFNDALAVEMEAAGFSETLQKYQYISFLTIRGISDLLDGKSGSDANMSQFLAAGNAAAFAFELIYQLNNSLWGQVQPAANETLYSKDTKDSPSPDMKEKSRQIIINNAPVENQLNIKGGNNTFNLKRGKKR